LSEVIKQLGDYIDAKINPIRFFDYVKILDATTNQVISYEKWRHLDYFVRAVYTYPLVIVLKARQIGISWTLAGIALHGCYRTGANTLVLSKGEGEAADLLRKSRNVYEYLPKFLQQEKDHEGAVLLNFKKTHSRILSLPSTKNAGVGQTASFIIWDENEFHEYAAENYGQVKPTIDAGGAHGVVVSTTDPTSIDSHFKTLWRGARGDRKGVYPIPGVNLMVNEGEAVGDNGFFPIFLGYDVRPGRDSEWYEGTKKNLSPGMAVSGSISQK